ncbi:hypothetical protein [Acinetobacter baumannii]|uniref:hypothetical protein n=1 Tax=Acinetobacter baumannii TaxID=470 RepID=UPI00201D0B61|nr:hypothetical protein [Acinetobacter baumannii]MCL6695272.1 hypothetical protein [Acinetobacter baumannii]
MNLSLIDSILLNSKKIKISERGLQALNSEFFKDIIINIALLGVEEGIYDFKNTIRQYLLKNIDKITINDVKEFEKKFPYIHINSEFSLNFSVEQLRKSKLFLFNKNAYRINSSLKTTVNSSTFNNLYKNTLAYEYLHFEILDELSLNHSTSRRKYASVPTKNFDNKNLTRTRIIQIIKIIESINLAFSLNNIKYKSIKIDLASIFNHVENINNNRTTTLPSNVIFKAFQDAFIYVHKYMEYILDTFLNIITDVESSRNLKSPKFKSFKEKLYLNYIKGPLKELDITCWSTYEFLDLTSNNKNIGLTQAYQLLIGSISILIGIVMARRQSEILSLSATNALNPPNINPEEFPQTEFFLLLNNAKSGSGGKIDLREELTLPIPTSIAKIIYKLQNFNKTLINYFPKFAKHPTLLSSLDPLSISFGYINQTTHNHYLDYFCDYFETPIITNESQIQQRYYIRQHQLRRFFAMLFFWANSFSGIDSLRKFLGHTRMDHVYNYITETTPGEVLAGVKAQYIAEHLALPKEHTSYIQNIEALEPLLKEHFSIGYFDYLSYEEVSENYDHSLTKKELEEYFYTLLSNSIIDIKPMFFTSQEESHIRSFKLILIVNENDNIN